MKAIWKGVVVAESENTELIEGNHYFPKEDINTEYFKESETRTICSWKGTASYYTLEIGKDRNTDSAWFYPDPKEAAYAIKGMVAFWKGVEVIE